MSGQFLSPGGLILGAIDGANAWRIESQLQCAADASALAAAANLPNEALARTAQLAHRRPRLTGCGGLTRAAAGQRSSGSYRICRAEQQRFRAAELLRELLRDKLWPGRASAAADQTAER